MELAATPPEAAAGDVTPPGAAVAGDGPYRAAAGSACPGDKLVPLAKDPRGSRDRALEAEGSRLLGPSRGALLCAAAPTSAAFSFGGGVAPPSGVVGAKVSLFSAADAPVLSRERLKRRSRGTDEGVEEPARPEADMPLGLGAGPGAAADSGPAMDMEVFPPWAAAGCPGGVTVPLLGLSADRIPDAWSAGRIPDGRLLVSEGLSASGCRPCAE